MYNRLICIRLLADCVCKTPKENVSDQTKGRNYILAASVLDSNLWELKFVHQLSN